MIQSEWDSPEQNYIYFVFAGRWNWQELSLATREASQLAVSARRPLCYIFHFIDEIGRRHVPMNVLAYTTATKTYVPPNVTRIILVNASSVTIGIMSVVFRLAPDLKDFYAFAPTLEEGERLAVIGGQPTDML